MWSQDLNPGLWSSKASAVSHYPHCCSRPCEMWACLLFSVIPSFHVPISPGRWDHRLFATFMPLCLCSCCSLCHECPSPCCPTSNPDPPLRPGQLPSPPLVSLPPPCDPSELAHEPWLRTTLSLGLVSAPSTEVLAVSPSMLLSAFSSHVHAVLRVGATECVSNGQKDGWMEDR